MQEKKRKKKPTEVLSPSLFLPFFHSFILCLIVLFVLGIFMRHPLIPCRAFLALLQGVNESISSKRWFLFPWGSRRPDNVTEASANRLVENTAAFFPSFYSHCVCPFLFNSPLLLHLLYCTPFIFHHSFYFVSFFFITSFLLHISLYHFFCLIHPFKQSFSRHFSIFPFLFYPFLPLLSSMCEELWQTQHHVFVCVRLGGGRQLSDSIVTLSTSPHSTAHPATGFLPPLHPSRPRARKAASGPSQARTEDSLWGCRGHRCWRMRTRDPGQAPEPRPWSGLPVSPLKGLRGWAQRQGKRGGGGWRSQQR